MGETVHFPMNGHDATGYLAQPVGETGPGVVVIQEWWGVNDHIKDVVDRLAAAGFSALAPDLYDGRVVDEPDEAAKAMMAMQLSDASKRMVGAVRELERRTGRQGVGVIGFCMGGGLAYVLAAEVPTQVRALVPFYGVIPWQGAEPDYSRITAAIQGHYAEHDDFASPDRVRALEARLRELGADVEFFIYPGTHHAFFNDSRPEVYDALAARQAWDRMIPFLHEHLGS
ncbi:Carboxymethylenebutenolidase [Acidimicrobium ferrooxidans DSM 10331]|uniref:Carboxymethylenebutenolidase n=1 Tax=Acidimicrobium ferrooxidans (strain DSM 10331 / JCM 15462 / NBRC 103882 / ICP) TaxID=525909 RepID=C7M149_ACIFD|nr:dienelactone hydrolase family protein [Acidimicrobium ferrooxidans]ACU54697.1 Carboxymethylenebutenolidase [Acidimicrobium ferrooxidans DSM 10331]